jgi:hypothetical protein
MSSSHQNEVRNAFSVEETHLLPLFLHLMPWIGCAETWRRERPLGRRWGAQSTYVLHFPGHLSRRRLVAAFWIPSCRVNLQEGSYSASNLGMWVVFVDLRSSSEYRVFMQTYLKVPGLHYWAYQGLKLKLELPKNHLPKINFKMTNFVPAGTILSYAVDDTSQLFGWAACNGAVLSTGSFPDLFGVIGYSNGGSGSVFFLPDMRGRFIRGKSLSRGWSFSPESKVYRCIISPSTGSQGPI